MTGFDRGPRPLVAVILAAGLGKRMRSALPKVLHRAGGRPLLAWVAAAARAAGCERVVAVIGHGAEDVRREMARDPAGAGLEYALQAEQKGTGHALAQARRAVPEAATLVVLSGDVPLVRPATLAALAALAARAGGGAWGALAVAELADPGSLGRVIARPRAGGGEELERIVEARDAAPAELALRRINAGLYALPAPEVFAYLDRLDDDNAQGELYLTDALGAAAADGRSIALHALADPAEALGVNTREELAAVDRLLRRRDRDEED
jgi:bifunctional UDP-N-acetylglucosamine pyrophosphorylase/glucosamine-1-phosphate N-acetyltransferase